MSFLLLQAVCHFSRLLSVVYIGLFYTQYNIGLYYKQYIYAGSLPFQSSTQCCVEIYCLLEFVRVV
jgi:hypothetical protein